MAAKIKYPVVNGMKECGECHRWKPISEYRKARKHYMAKCINCLNIWAAQYRKRPEVKKAIAIYHKNYMKIQKNKDRANARQRKYNKTQKYKDYRNKNRKEWTAEQKRKAVLYKGGKCVICGYSLCLAAMDFHHINPKEKDGYGTGALKSHWSFEKNRKEIDKCILVCVRCHRELHAGVTICPSAS